MIDNGTEHLERCGFKMTKKEDLWAFTRVGTDEVWKSERTGLVTIRLSKTLRERRDWGVEKLRGGGFLGNQGMDPSVCSWTGPGTTKRTRDEEGSVQEL